MYLSTMASSFHKWAFIIKYWQDLFSLLAKILIGVSTWYHIGQNFQSQQACLLTTAIWKCTNRTTIIARRMSTVENIHKTSFSMLKMLKLSFSNKATSFNKQIHIYNICITHNIYNQKQNSLIATVSIK